MKKITFYLQAVSLLIIAGFVAGCAMLQVKTYPQEEEVMYGQNWKLKIENVHNYENTLEVGVSVTNTGKQAVAKRCDIYYHLVTENGATYNPTNPLSHNAAGVNYNPNQKREDTVLFSDVPKDNYNLVVEEVCWGQGGKRLIRQLFQWKIQ